MDSCPPACQMFCLLMHWPANLSLPPRWEDVASAVRDSFRRLRNRCKVPSSCAYVDIETHSCISLIWNHVQSSSAGPVSWAVLDRAKQWIAECNFFVSVFDHNLSTLALVCPKLAYRNACHLLDFGPYAHDAANLVWKLVDDAGVQQLLKNLCTVPGLPGHLSPAPSPLYLGVHGELVPCRCSLNGKLPESNGGLL